jgi:hypothetical protein
VRNGDGEKIAAGHDRGKKDDGDRMAHMPHGGCGRADRRQPY